MYQFLGPVSQSVEPPIFGPIFAQYEDIPGMTDIEVPSRVDGKRRYLARVRDFVSWDEAYRVPRHKITHECKIPPLSIHK